MNFALSEVVAMTHGTTKHSGTEETSTLESFRQYQPSGHKCQAASTLRFPASLFIYDQGSILVGPASLNRGLYKYVWVLLGYCILYPSGKRTIDRLSKRRCMYNPMGLHFFCLYTANHVHTTEKDCCSCIQDGSELKHEPNFQLFKLLHHYNLWPLISRNHY